MKKLAVAAIAAMFTLFVGGAALNNAHAQQNNLNGYVALNDTIVPDEPAKQDSVIALTDTVVPDSSKTICLNDTVVPNDTAKHCPNF